jgi:ribonuclease-3
MIFKRRRKEGVEALLGVAFKDSGLLRRALTHRSYAHERALGWDDTNERLEFLGDAVLDLVISDYMYRSHAHLDEGELTRIRSYLVNMNSLAEMAREAGIGPYILLSRDERADGGEDKASILADTLEALIGAVYLDRGLDEARKLVMRLVKERLDEALSGPLDFDYKSRLQERVVKRKGVLPKYKMQEKGPDHRKVFFASVYVEGRKLGQGSGSSKKDAEQAAAKQALESGAFEDAAREDG